MKHIKKYESEILSGGSSGLAGTSSLPYNKGFYQYGANTGQPGIAFTPNSEPTINSYKKNKYKKKKLKYTMKKFKEFIKEDATSTIGNSNGMGAIVAAQPSANPGSLNSVDSIPGSGDIGNSFGNTYMKNITTLKKKKKRKGKRKRVESYDGFNYSNENIEIDNFTARYYDDFDDEEEPANEQDLLNITKENIRKVQLYEKN